MGIVAALLQRKGAAADVPGLVTLAARDGGLASFGLTAGTAGRVRDAVDAALPRVDCPQRRRPPTDCSKHTEGTLGVVTAQRASALLLALHAEGITSIHPRLAPALRAAAARRRSQQLHDAPPTA